MSSKADVERFFKEYIFGFIQSDIQREIDLARSGQQAGNFLSALGLLCYTEFMGAIYLGGFDKTSAKGCFDAFFNFMGASYADFNKRVNVYDVFRCGMAHQYFIKQNCIIYMLKTNEPAGIGMNSVGQYCFIVEKYFEDFISACQRLYQSIISQQKPFIPST